MKHKPKLSKSEQQIANVLTYHEKELQAISFPKSDQLDLKIAKLELEMQAAGIDIGKAKPVQQEVSIPKVLVLPDWDRLCAEAERSVGSECDIENLFTEEELTGYVESHFCGDDKWSLDTCVGYALAHNLFDRTILGVELWANGLPRKILGYRTPDEAFEAEMDRIFAV